MIFILIIFIIFILTPLNKVNSGWIIQNNNIIQVSETIWTNHFSQPYIISYPIKKLWFIGNEGVWKVGSAEPIVNSIFWKPSPIASISPLDGQIEIVEVEIIYDEDSHLYQMWYISRVNQNWQSGMDRYRLYYAISVDSNIWTNHIPVLLGENTENTWDCGGPARGISIIKDKGVYHLWYTATNSDDMSINPNWKIGYATSINGINWNKQNNINPVIYPSASWDLYNQSFPNVILENNKFLMWYGAGNGDQPTQYNFAESDDGIHWYKPPEINPVLTIQPNTFFSVNLAGNQAIDEGDHYHMYFSGYNNSVWSIGDAIVPKSDYTPYITPAPTPTLISTITPIPTLTPTTIIVPTPNPTGDITPTATSIPTNTLTPPTIIPPSPTQATNTKNTIIIIPGITATWNPNALLQCEPGDNGGTWSYLPIAAKAIYSPSENAFMRSGYNIKHFLYDWRLPVPQNAIKLHDFIRHNLTSSDVYLLGHSMGGLIARSYAEKYSNQTQVKKILTVGAPFEGSVNAYYTWSGGQFIGDLVSKMYATLLLSRCVKHKFSSGANAIHTYIPSISDLLPTFPYLINQQTNTLIPIQAMSAKNTLPKNDQFANPYNNITIGSLNGTSFDTAKTITVTTLSKHGKDQWIDGKPIAVNPIDYSTNGDSTVLIDSATILHNTVDVQSLDHTVLMTDPNSINSMIGFFSDSIQSNHISQKKFAGFNKNKDDLFPNRILSFVGFPVHFIVFQPNGLPIPAQEGIVEILNPQEGNYRIVIQPTTSSSSLSIGELSTNGDVDWKSFEFTSKLPKIKTYHYKIR